jgi:hypothetical protein
MLVPLSGKSGHTARPTSRVKARVNAEHDVVGEAVGEMVGELVGDEVVGEPVGGIVGDEVVGEPVGEVVGDKVVGESVGEIVGDEVVGEAVGEVVVGEVVGEAVGEVVVGEAVDTASTLSTVRIRMLEEHARTFTSPFPSVSSIPLVHRLPAGFGEIQLAVLTATPFARTIACVFHPKGATTDCRTNALSGTNSQPSGMGRKLDWHVKSELSNPWVSTTPSAIVLYTMPATVSVLVRGVNVSASAVAIYIAWSDDRMDRGGSRDVKCEMIVG